MARESKDVPVKTEGKGGAVESMAWEPFSSLRGEIDRLFDEFSTGWPFGRLGLHRHLSPEPRPGSFGIGGLGMPAVDVVDKEKEVTVKVDLPGIEEKDLEVQLSDDMLTIRGEKKEEHEEGEEKGNYYLSERRYGSFERSFRVPQGIDRDKVAATFRKGVLTVTLPKTKEAQKKSRKIDVKAEK